jgi:hypothetical protein
MSTTQELVERLRDVAGWTAIIEKHRRKTDDPSITYVLKDGTRIHEDDSYVAKLAATLSRALEDTADISKAAAARLDELERSVEGLRAMHKLIASNLGEYIDREGSVDVIIALAFETARAALAGSGEK